MRHGGSESVWLLFEVGGSRCAGVGGRASGGGAAVQHVGDAVHVGDQAALGGADGVEAAADLILQYLPMRGIRGKDMTMILQNPMTSLDPLFTIGDQALEVLRLRRPGVKSTESDAIDLLRKEGASLHSRKLRAFDEPPFR